MQTFKSIVFSFLIIFLIGLAVVLTMASPDDTGFLFSLLDYMKVFRVLAYIALLAGLITVYFYFNEQRRNAKLEKAKQSEINELKAKLYDKKETAQKVTEESPKKIEPTSEEENSESKED